MNPKLITIMIAFTAVRIMTDKYHFDILDKVAINRICHHLPIHDTIRLKMCSKRLNYIVSMYLSDVSYKPEYIIPQYSVIAEEIYRLDTRLRELHKTKEQLLAYINIHDGPKPDGYMSK